ncbi:hypothetical protein AOLI_G00134020 [Acnodon oligacanthus]
MIICSLYWLAQVSGQIVPDPAESINGVCVLIEKEKETDRCLYSGEEVRVVKGCGVCVTFGAALPLKSTDSWTAGWRKQWGCWAESACRVGLVTLAMAKEVARERGMDLPC